MLSDLLEDMAPLEEMARRLAQDKIKPKSSALDRYPFAGGEAAAIDALLDELDAQGLLAVTAPEAWGGLGLGVDALSVIIYALSEVDASFALPVFTAAFSQGLLAKAGGTPPWQAETASGRDRLVAFPLFETPGRISSLPQASRTATDFTLTGAVRDLAMGRYARRALVPAILEGESDYAYFLVELAGPSVRCCVSDLPLGMRALPLLDLDLTATPAQLVGAERGGGEIFSEVAARFQAAAAAMSAGLMRGALQEVLAYAQERHQGGRAIINWSEVRMMIGAMAARSRTADACVAATCQAVEADSPGWRSLALGSATLVHELACQQGDDGLQALGGVGYMRDFPQEKRYRDARQLQALLGAAPLRKLALVDRLLAGA